MAGGGAVNQLRKQMEALNAAFTTSLAELNARQDVFDDRLISIQSSLGTLTHYFNDLFGLIKNLLCLTQESASTNESKDKRTLDPKVNSVTPSVNYSIPEVDFPRFKKDDINGWLRKCNAFSRLYSLTDEEKVLYASFHLDGRADTWLQATFKTLDGVSWEQFSDALISRFCNRVNVIGDFNKLQQTGSVLDYLEKFEELKPLVRAKYPELTDSYFMYSFLGGLKSELQYAVQMFEPKTLDRAICLARLQEAYIDSLTLKLGYDAKNLQKPDPKTPLQKNLGKTPEQGPLPPIKRITPLEMQARIEKGLCYCCEEPYVFGHRCKKMQIYMMTTDEEEKSGNKFGSTSIM